MVAQKTVIVGGGILGCAMARALAAAGEDVTVFEAERVGQAASGRSFGWINASFHADAHHFALRQEGMVAWRRLEAERGTALPIAWCGALCWEEQGAAQAAQQDGLRTLGYAVDRLDQAALAARLPRLGDLPEEALLFADEGVAETERLTRELAADAARMGARFVTGVAVEAVTTRGEQISGVRTAQGEVTADRVVIAAGVGSQALAESVGVALPMLSRPGLLLTTLQVAPVLDTVLVTPEGEIRQLPDGRIMMPTSVGHQSDRAEAIIGAPQEIAETALARIRRYFPKVDLRLGEVSLAWRPVPGDGLPVVGAAGPDGLYLCTMHSGITLAAVAAELAVGEMLGKAKAGLLSPYRPERFA